MVVSTKFGTYADDLAKYVRPTIQLDFDVAKVKKLSNDLTKDAKTPLQAIKALWTHVASLPLGYDHEHLKASEILEKGRGQCNTKTTLFIALARNAGIPSRPHAWKIHKIAHKHHMHPVVFHFAPKQTIFTYPEVFYNKKWRLVSEVICKKDGPNWNSCPFDDAEHRKHPLKKSWIAKDLGDFWHTDRVYKEHGTNTKGWRKYFFPIAQLLLNR